VTGKELDVDADSGIPELTSIGLARRSRRIGIRIHDERRAVTGVHDPVGRKRDFVMGSGCHREVSCGEVEER
jgi:hypothetical protein